MTVTPSIPSLTPFDDLDATFLPIGHMRQIVRVTRFDGPLIEGDVDLAANHWVFAEHFPGDPIFPGALQIEAAGQLVALWAWGNGARGRPRLVRISAIFHRPIGPDTGPIRLVARVICKRRLQFATIELLVAGQPVATVEAVLTVLSQIPSTEY